MVEMAATETVYTKANPAAADDEMAVTVDYNRYTLIHSGNANSVLNALYDHAMRSEIVPATIILDNERKGDMVTIETDFGEKTGIITKLDTDINNRRIANVEVRC